MGIRGRKSAVAELLGRPQDDDGRPDAPYTLTDKESDEWRAIVATMAPGYFRRSHYPMLPQLCRHVVASNRTAMLVEQLCRQKKLNIPELATLHAMQKDESQIIISLCRQLRLSHQQIYRADGTKQRPAPVSDVPWSRGDRC